MAIDPEELEPRRRQPEKRNLEPMSIEELETYVADLQAEIDRAREMIAHKRKGRAGAESLFRKD